MDGVLEISFTVALNLITHNDILFQVGAPEQNALSRLRPWMQLQLVFVAEIFSSTTSSTTRLLSSSTRTGEQLQHQPSEQTVGFTLEFTKTLFVCPSKKMFSSTVDNDILNLVELQTNKQTIKQSTIIPQKSWLRPHQRS